MRILLNNVYEALEEEIITKDEALYILFTHSEEDYPIEPESLKKLVELKYIHNNKAGIVLLTEDSPIKGVIGGTMTANHFNDISKEIPVTLCKLLCVKDIKTGELKLPGTEDTINQTATTYLQNEGLIAYHYIIMLFMFPVKGKSNRRWEKHFSSYEYKGARLRLRTKSTAKKFKVIAKNKDMGAFLYGTYLFIQSGIQENKTFIKTVANYLKEYDDWYDEAYEIIKDAKTVNELFTKTVAKEGRLNIAL